MRRTRAETQYPAAKNPMSSKPVRALDRTRRYVRSGGKGRSALPMVQAVAEASALAGAGLKIEPRVNPYTKCHR
jgi:hypothetical protein